MNKRLLYGLLIFYFAAGCSKSNEADLADEISCDTVNMQFMAHIVPILKEACYSCHSNTNMAISGISLEGYGNVKARVNDGKLIGSVTHAPGFKAMPQGSSRLSECSINKIRSWINRGSLDN